MSIDPISLMSIGRVISVGSGIISTIGNMNAASYQSAVAARNAQIAEQNAVAEIERSQQEQADWGADARGQMGSLVASLAASGASLQGGSGELRQRGAQRLLSRDAERIREEGETTAGRYRQQAADFRAESGMARKRRSNSLFSGVLDIGTTYLSNSSRIARGRNALIV